MSRWGWNLSIDKHLHLFSFYLYFVSWENAILIEGYEPSVLHLYMDDAAGDSDDPSLELGESTAFVIACYDQTLHDAIFLSQR